VSPVWQGAVSSTTGLTGREGRLPYEPRMMTLLRKAFWVALFLAFTLGFVTLFDHGYVTTSKFTTDAKSEVNELIDVWHPIKRDKDNSDDIAK